MSEVSSILKVAVPGAEYDIHFCGELAPELFRPYVGGKTVFAITDSNVSPLHLGTLYECLGKAGASKIATMEFPAGEQSKKFTTVEDICRTAASRGLDRSSVFVALGGGVVGDLTGFASAIFMRGTSFLQVPTSLLAAVDSSVGGKTGCDLPEGKNLIGAFHQPLGVIVNSRFLATLPDREYRCGCAEAIKMACILDEPFFSRIEREIDLLRARDEAFTLRLIRRSCELKAQVVAKDEKENSVRAILNYGHTFGHAFEAVSGYTLPHGEAVALGAALMTRFAAACGRMKETDAARQRALFAAAGLPVEVPEFDPEAVFKAMLRDKKFRSGRLRFIVSPETGRAEIVEFEPEKVFAFLESL